MLVSAIRTWLIAQGLATFSIDKASLQSAGLSGEAIGHLYRALYVYTIGFQDKVRNLFVPVEHKQLPLNNIWRAYLAIAESAMEVGFKVYRHSVNCSATLSVITMHASTMTASCFCHDIHCCRRVLM